MGIFELICCKKYRLIEKTENKKEAGSMIKNVFIALAPAVVPFQPLLFIVFVRTWELLGPLSPSSFATSFES